MRVSCFGGLTRGTSFANFTTRRPQNALKQIVQCELSRRFAGFCRLLEQQQRGAPMKKVVDRSGKAGYIIAWLLGVPIPILLLVFLLRGCN
jgi:hypothetical protein